MGSLVIDQQALAFGCVHWKCTVPYSNVVKRTAQTICIGYKENIMVLESGYFFDYLRHWNWFLLSLLIFNLVLYILLFAGEGATGREQPQGRKVTLAGPKSDIGRAEKSHKGQNVTLECFNTSNSIVLYTCSHPSNITMCQQEYDCTRKCVDNVIIWRMLLCRYA